MAVSYFNGTIMYSIDGDRWKLGGQRLRRRVHAHQHLVPGGKQKQPEGGALVRLPPSTTLEDVNRCLPRASSPTVLRFTTYATFPPPCKTRFQSGWLRPYWHESNPLDRV